MNMRSSDACASTHARPAGPFHKVACSFMFVSSWPQRMRDGLRHAVACRAPSHMECPTFQRLLRAAAAGRYRQHD
jgi:hypothetical protein